MEPINFLLAGVGGQGVLLAADVLSEVGLLAGYDVKQSEIHGMAQRGGSVTTHVRWAQRVDAPMAGKGEVDVLLGFELLESLRYIDYLRPGGQALLSSHRIPPVSVTSGGAEYPDDLRARGIVEQVTKDYRVVPAVQLGDSAGDARSHNVVMLGVLSRRLAVDEAIWLDVLSRHVPARALEINRRAFRAGRELETH